MARTGTTIEQAPPGRLADVRAGHVAQILIGGREFGGAERYLVETSPRLRALGYTVSFILPPNSILRDRLAEGELPVVWAPIRGDINPLTPPRVAHALRHLGADLLNVHDNGASVPCILGGRLAGLPVVSTVHAFHPRLTFLGAHHLITVSDALREHLMAQGVPAGRITTVRNGIDSAAFAPREARAARRALGLDEDACYFIYIGRFSPGKRLDLQLAQLQRLVAHAPRAHLLIAGSGKREIDVRQWVAERALEAHVHFLGFQADIQPALAAADCLLLTSDSEGLGLVILEAMAMGRAVISTDSGGPRELVRDGVTGRLVPVGDGEALYRAMREAVEQPAWLADAGNCGREIVEREHTLDRQVAGIAEVYQRVRMSG